MNVNVAKRADHGQGRLAVRRLLPSVSQEKPKLSTSDRTIPPQRFAMPKIPLAGHHTGGSVPPTIQPALFLRTPLHLVIPLISYFAIQDTS